MSTLTRRAMIGSGLCGCAMHGARVRAERVRPMAMGPLVVAGYRPVDADEKGLWQSCALLEVEIASSNLLLNAPAMQRYTQSIMDRLLGPLAAGTRVYLIHDAAFNASMTPNGMMIVNTGLIARCRDEAQFATVLGHECAHFLRRHSVQRWRERRSRTGVMAFVAAGAGAFAGMTFAAGYDGRGWIDMANGINGALAVSILRFGRAQEEEADAYGIRLIDEAGYPPEAAAQIWRQFVEERRASARARDTRYRDASVSVYSTHPPTQQRMLDLSASARELDAAAASRAMPRAASGSNAAADFEPVPGRDAGRSRWRAVVAQLRASLIEEQVKLNDPGASLYLIDALAQDGWDGALRYYEGEAYRLRDDPGDAALAAQSYARAVATTDAPAEAWRAHGYALLKHGDAAQGRRSLAQYLERRPGAVDAAMIRAALAP